MYPHLPLRIIKLGGSLLTLDDLSKRFHSWLESQPPARNLIVVGGGDTVEAIRELDAIHRFQAVLSHWVCVDLMSVTASMASELLGLGEPISTEQTLRDFLLESNRDRLIACIQPPAYYSPSISEQTSCELPESWECTSDSISAWLATSLAADQLVLLKSVENEFGSSSRLSSEQINALADVGAVDPVFPEACKHLKDVRVVNLRFPG